ncbi:MAG: GNAT family N-acetyltransferase [bacterium]|nr:GNAT family N-acetyltransferase [bacterium]
MTVEIAHADEQILGCFPVMQQLRPHLEREAFVERVRLQQQEGYLLIFAADDGAPQAVAGFRMGHNLAWGRYLYVDDLCTAATERSRGYGRVLLSWLVEHARTEGCDELHLDSGTQRLAAHRFYLRERMDITSFHFVRRLS